MLVLYYWSISDEHGSGNRPSPGIIAIHDDICIYSHTPEDHDQHLLMLIQTVALPGIVFNSSKCHIRQPQITFYGAMFTVKGMWPDPSKI